MCGSCGCGRRVDTRGVRPGTERPRVRMEWPGQGSGARTLRLELDLLEKNEGRAREVRDWVRARSLALVNVMGGPGAGKTALLEETARALGGAALAVIEGDQETEQDAERLRAVGCPVVQINTGRGCHLDAAMVAAGLEALSPAPGTILFVENVGNLVCPALFDLGEGSRVVVLSVTEGDDKPSKYPHMFRAADLLVISKVDLLRHVQFDLDACVARARALNPELRVVETSTEGGWAGLDGWLSWVAERAGRFEGRGAES